MFLASQYLFDLGPGQFLAVSLRGEQTQLTLQSDGIGQQQSQSSAFLTGAWLLEPNAWQFGGTCYLCIQAEGGTTWLQVGHGQVGLGSAPPRGALPVPARAMSGPPRTPVPPPLPPLKPMEMQMGNMRMSMGRDASPPEPQADLREENLRLREENLKLREEVMQLREQLWNRDRG